MKKFLILFSTCPFARLCSALSSVDANSPRGTKECQASHPILNRDAYRKQILSGRVYQQENFLSEDEVQILLSDINRLIEENKMIPSGLSNTSKGNEQNFGKSDRMTCPVPWWIDSLQGNRLEFVQGNNAGSTDPSEDNKSVVMNKISDRLQRLRYEVSDILNRPTMKESSHEHECYYSRSAVGSSLKRHMDEFHEETKGPRGWILPSRRSVSWLVYLSDPDIEGGELRSFVQEEFVSGDEVEVGANDGNLQVGWLDFSESSTVPVFMNSWYKPVEAGNLNLEPFCILYTAIDGKHVYITKPWINSMDRSFADFIRDQKLGAGPGLFVTNEFRTDFRLLEDRQAWEQGFYPAGSTVRDIVPKRGSLVMFDSVSVPHEVLAVKSGVRPALAGWFHEQTQSIPEDFY